MRFHQHSPYADWGFVDATLQAREELGDQTDDTRFTEYFAQAVMEMAEEQGRDINVSWDGSWISAGRIDDQGFTVEIAIPLTTLRFKEGIESWGLNVSRIIRYPKCPCCTRSNSEPCHLS